MTVASKKIIMASGVFDLMHPGHIYYLEQSRSLGDELVVVVTNDAVASRKGKTLFDAESRRHMVAALAVVDRAVIPTETDPARYYRTVLDLNPSVITLGHDQHFDETALRKELNRYGWQGKVVRIGKMPGQAVSSSALKQKLHKERS
jgi:FAD synthetase